MWRRGQGRAQLDLARSGCFIPVAVPPSQADVPTLRWVFESRTCPWGSLPLDQLLSPLWRSYGGSGFLQSNVSERSIWECILLTADPRSVVARPGWWDSHSTLLWTRASQMTERSLIFKLFSSIIHAAGVMGRKKEEFHWVGLLDTEQSRGWKWDPALLKLKFFGGDGEYLCKRSCIRLTGRDAPASADGSHHHASHPDPDQASAGKNYLQNWEASGFAWGCIPHQPEPWFGGSRDRVGVPTALPADLLCSRWKHRWVIFR